MRCLKCGYTESKVNDSRVSEDFKTIKRRRECLSCGFRFNTYERVEVTPLMVIKKNNLREIFDREKLLKGILVACQKRPVTREMIDMLVDEVESNLGNNLVNEIRSQDIGLLVMEKLKKIDQIAYVRFASVYKDFKDVKEFRREISELLK
jgi:transcriptional repressor NrdR